MDSSGQPVIRLFDAQGRVMWQTGKRGAQLLRESAPSRSRFSTGQHTLAF